MRPTTMVDNNCIIEGNVKFRDGKKWKSRWCVMRKLSPVADCLHLQLYGDSKDRHKQGQTKASLSLQHFLGIESGFTLDKESNTIAIICQDLIVVLAFDTRERLIQWQVKISNNLGEDQQFLIMISTAPSKAKIANGPAHLHIQDRRFCITVGVPPRLVGVWEIAHLRRYGVVEGKFCFEGGSRCGRGEGLHVLITDQGDDIVKTLHLAAEGRLVTRKRPLGRDISSHDSPRRQFIRSETRASDFFPQTVYSSYKEQMFNKEQFEISKTSEISPCWSSTESRHNVTELDGDYNCRETGSVIELTNQQSEWRSGSLPRQSTSGLERCASCISKLGVISKTSACAAVSTAAVTAHSPVSGNNNPNNPACHSQQPRAFDRLSLSSYSSSSHDSDYSASQIAESTNSIATKISPSQEQQYDKEQEESQPCSSPVPTALPPRPQKPSNVIKKVKKPPMPLPIEQQICTCKQKVAQNTTGNKIKSGPYENYDVPKTILAHHMSLEPPVATQTDQYYDTPRKIKECLALPKNYPNYDTPHAPQAVVLQHCGCPAKIPAQSPRSSGCPCHNVMSWAGFVLPYCRRGAGIEPTGVTVHPVKLSGEGKMPVVNASGELAIYPTNTKSHHHDGGNKNSNIWSGNNSCDYSSNSTTNNYENIQSVIDTQPESKHANYVNIDFNESLEHYENSRDIIARMGISQEEIEIIADELKETTNNVEMIGNENIDDAKDTEKNNCDEHKLDKVCNKCGHVKDNITNYLLMDPDKQSMKKPFAGYLPMQPAHNTCSKDVISRICGGNKSSSNPTLFGSTLIDSGRKRSDSELRIPGSAMLSSPYLRRRLIDPSHAIDATVSLEMLWRKRSYSAESTNYLEDTSPGFSSTVSIHKCPSETNKLLSTNKDHHHQSMISTNSDLKVNRECDESNNNSQPFSIKIRRSSSVPSKTGHNRDSSSSNDSGVSTGSLTHRNAEFVEFEFSLAPINSSRKQNILTVCRKSPPPICYHNSLPRKSKSSDPLRELSFQFQKLKIPTKSSSAEGDIPTTCVPKGTKGFNSPGETTGTPYIDSRSTSSGTSDMSDYIETLSLSSHSSSDTPDSLRLGGRAVATTLRPRSGKEYYKLDRSILTEQGRAMTTTPSSYANITPVLEKSESPSPGYMSSSPFEQPQTSREHFLFPEEV
ncbi:hypothetical protein PV328_005689 [Microctonus aethiopoides]|uniref:IRS-type PTB domain-containing protein n=1 Tax=Microctonus aethiopoides TaxID=144406 RepID=A0AA39KSR0_9HYME|nr:hypothetical protein PV328_005689 [Microctonus aethiopoides]